MTNNPSARAEIDPKAIFILLTINFQLFSSKIDQLDLLALPDFNRDETEL